MSHRIQSNNSYWSCMWYYSFLMLKPRFEISSDTNTTHMTENNQNDIQYCRYDETKWPINGRYCQFWYQNPMADTNTEISHHNYNPSSRSVTWECRAQLTQDKTSVMYNLTVIVSSKVFNPYLIDIFIGPFLKY